MRDVKLLDVTLRDGGCVNNFNFGLTYMNKIRSSQEDAGVDCIEVGYIDQINGSYSNRTKFIDERSIADSFITQKNKGIIYLAMIDYGKYDLDKLTPKSDEGIDGLRIAFHKKDYKNALTECRKVLDKGYKLFIQPMLTCWYSEYELLDMISEINNNLSDATALYIVDSFGEMHPEDVASLFELFDEHLAGSIAIGFHSHNNMQLSFSNACTFLSQNTERSLYLDSSIMGMGKGAGNLSTELIIEHLNRNYGKNYSISPLLSVIDEVINQIRSEYYWGYAVEFYLSSINHCSPTYASHFYSKHMLPIDRVDELLKTLSLEKKISFDEAYAEEVYRKYNEKTVIDDSDTVSWIKKKISEKKILLIAPGKSVSDAKESIEELMKKGFVSFGLNMSLDFPLDFYITTRVDVFERLSKDNKQVIVLSNIVSVNSENVHVLDYKKWIEVNDETHDSSAVIAFKLLKECEAKDIVLAGFDGFSVNVNENYYDPDLRHPISVTQQEKNNIFYKKLIKSIKEYGINVTFLTPSKYDE
ncbi:MAG: aldolase catalytic domain-containing protein [Lachnospiraceae bacterium]|nr:aldolase catalytic domain-containing protein [Lachnospiraceae bacterium]